MNNPIVLAAIFSTIGILGGALISSLFGKRGNDASAIAAITEANRVAMEGLRQEVLRLSGHVMLLEATLRANGLPIPIVVPSPYVGDDRRAAV